jgi:hypothetical protein
MSEHAKSARAAMKAKAKRMGDAGDPKAQVDASSWTPPEMVNSGAKTGMRPVSKRAFKRGGKVLHVEGEQAHQHAGRKPRNAGGKALTPNNYINRNQKEANEERSGGDAHVGGYKHGGAPKHTGRKHRQAGGANRIQFYDWDKPQNNMANDRQTMSDYVATPAPNTPPGRGGAPLTEPAYGLGARPRIAPRRPAGPSADDLNARQLGALARQRMEDESARMSAPAPRATASAPMPDRNAGLYMPDGGGGGMKKGGKVHGRAPKHDDIVADRALVRKMVKGAALTGKKHGGEAGAHKAMRKHKADGGEIFDERDMPMPPARRMPRYSEDAVSPRPRRKSMKAREAEMLDALLRGRAHGGEVSSKRKHREDGGGAGGGDVHEPGDLIYGRSMPVPARQTLVTRPSEEPDVAGFRALQRAAAKRKDGGKADHGADCRCHKCSGGRMGKAEGGKIGDIGGERPHGGRVARRSGGKVGKGKTNVNIIISTGRPAIDGAAGQSGVPGGLGGPGAAPAVMPRQAPVMPPAAAPMPMPQMGGGMPMPPPQMPPPGPMMGRKAGGRVYRTYKDMDAGAGSGLGRLEKTEIERRK